MSRIDDRGFTLLETLLALSIVSLLMVALLGAFSFGQTVLRRTQAERDLVRELAVAQDVLSGALAEVPTTPAQMVSGSIDQLALYAYPPRSTGSIEPARTTFRFEHEGKRLIALWELLEPTSRAVQRELMLATGMRFSYLSERGEWLNAWQSQQAPQLIRLEITMATGMHRELVFAARRVNERRCMPLGSCTTLAR